MQIKRWLARRATELNNGVEDPVLVGYVVNMLEEKVGNILASFVSFCL